jgi:hypothetical protein
MQNSMNILLNKFTKITNYATKRNMALVAVTVLAYQTYKGYKSYKRFMLHHEKRKRLNEEQESAFENRYFKEYDQMKDDPDAPVPSANSHVRETTPQGDVIMTHDAERALFCYYCDKRTVQFKYLEPVARKYVVEHGCKRFYIDFRKELTRARHKAVTMPEATAAVTATAKPMSVFAQFKKYSNAANIKHPMIKMHDDKGLRGNEAQPVLKEQVTRYLYCGRLDDFVDASHESEPHDFNIIKPIDYASYKKMNE